MQGNRIEQPDKVTRFEVIGLGREYTRHDIEIELHYQECCSGKKQFGDKYIIVGDMNCDKNGYKYHVWGTSKDSSTWLEQNCTLNGAPSRQLRRTIIDKV